MVKRILDVFCALVGLILSLPLSAVIGGLIWVAMGRPILFIQTRPGKSGTPFDLYKFRTMTNACQDSCLSISDSQRSTRLGRFLRSTSLDELPELINILKGEMSIVGPRPLLVRYLDRYTPEQARRHEVKPGLTGWTQVNGRNALSWEEKFKLDVWYVDNQSFWLDIKIIFLTVIKVFKRDGISHSGEATMPEFNLGADRFSSK